MFPGEKLANPTSALLAKADPREEERRLAAVRRYNILDTPPDGAFDRIAATAAKIFAVPIAIVSIVDHDRIWFKSHHGLDVQEIGRDPGLCASAILQDDPWILTDAKRDVRSLANPLVAGDFGLRFYVGVPLKTSDGFNLGTLCVIDRAARSVTPDQIAHLENLAAVVMDQMELRLAASNAVADMSQVIAEKEKALQQSEMMAKEIDHRVMNSLQLASSLLVMQSRQIADPESSAQLAQAANRISTIARVHQHIFMGKEVGLGNCKNYLERICADLQALYAPERPPKIIVDAADVEVPTARIIPIGLIVNELTTNAAKQGASQIRVGFERAPDDGYVLSVEDNGAGLPDDFDPVLSSGLGMKVISALAMQLGSKLEFARRTDGAGAKFTVRISTAPTRR